MFWWEEDMKRVWNILAWGFILNMFLFCFNFYTVHFLQFANSFRNLALVFYLVGNGKFDSFGDTDGFWCKYNFGGMIKLKVKNED